MNPAAREKALVLLDAHTEALAPFYADLRQELLGSAATSHLVGRQEELAHDRANAQLVSNIIGLMPGSLAKVIPVTNLVEAKHVRENVLYFPEDHTDPNGTFRYIVGSSPYQTRKSKTIDSVELLLQPAHSSAGEPTLPPGKTKILKEDMAARKAAVRQDLARDLTEEDVDMLLDDPTGVMHMRQSSEMAWLHIPLAIDRVVHRKRRYHAGEVRRIQNRMLIKPEWSGVTLDAGISDRTLATFDVMKRLNELSVAFGVEEQAQQFIRDYLVRPDADEVVV